MSAPRAGFASEAELAAHVVAWLHDQRFEVYQEVDVGGWTCDIVGRRPPILFAVECKLTFSTSVVEQAYRWLDSAHYTAVAVPVGRRRGHTMLNHYCRLTGIGVLTVAPGSDPWARVSEELHPRLHRNIVGRLRERLHERQKTYAQAGNALGRRFTPFQGTCEALRDFVERNPGCTMKDAVKGIRHHYASSTARSALLKWLRDGIIKGVRVEETRPLTLHPERPTE